MSHTFWAGLVVWLSTLLVALCFYGRSRLQQPVHEAHERTSALAGSGLVR
ncbi:hypothetical protein ALP83_200003 [Pseudomonas syringae pv. actinidiae]|nr:hypothetical protein ALP83_200003 [Pseudomonas syringae pv. actinidiae]